MSNEKLPENVLVVGAGASADFGFPTGRELFSRLVERFSSSQYDGFRKGLAEVCGESDFADAASSLANTNADTIDEFLAEAERDLSQTVKIAMSYYLMEREAMFFRHNISDHNQSWYKELWNRAFATANGSTNLAVITFNYDRSLEAYLYRAESARQIAKQRSIKYPERMCEIVHMHGALGLTEPALEWWTEGKEQPTFSRAKSASRGVYLYNEKREEKILQRAKTLYAGAKQIAFLGFGFHKQNLVALGTPDSAIEIVSTGRDATDEWRAEVGKRMDTRLKWGKRDEGCLELLRGVVPGWTLSG